jgi:peptide/nickel transport system ATP-binding protein
MEPLLSVEDLNVHLGPARRRVPVVRGLDLEIGRGEFVCIVGESGCGKSVTSLALMDLLPSPGRREVRRLELEGQDLSALSQARMSNMRGRRLSMIFQDPMTSLNPSFTIGEQLQAVYMRHFGSRRETARARSIELLSQTGIADAQDRLRLYPHQLSGGLRQRVMIAMALMCEPSLLIADEPTTALDVTIQVQILKLMKQRQMETGLSILLITHDMSVVARVADRVLVMYAGQVVESGPTANVFEHPRHPYTQGLLGSILAPGRYRRGQQLETIPGTVPSLAEVGAGCAFRNRCPYAMEECGKAPVPMFGAGPDRAWRCILPGGAPERQAA